MKRTFSWLFILSISVVCGAFGNQTADDFSIFLERTGCQTGCPEYTVRIHADGTVVFEGKAFVKSKGVYRTHVGTREMENLLNDAIASGYFDLKSRYIGKTVVTYSNDGWVLEQQNRSESSATISEISVAGLQQRIENYGTAPELVSRIEERIDKLANTGQWIH